MSFAMIGLGIGALVGSGIALRVWAAQNPDWGHGDEIAVRYLERRGWKLARGFYWHPPKPGHKETPHETSALNHLFLEWDYGGVIGHDVSQAEYDAWIQQQRNRPAEPASLANTPWGDE